MTLFEAPSAGQDTLTVGELARCLRQTLDSAFPSGVWVTGEIDGLTRARSGHVYFDLVERAAGAPGATPSAVVSIVLFRADRERVNRMINRYGNAMRMADGVQVRIQAMVDFYARRGQLQLRMTSIDPAHTLGAIAAYRAAVLAKLTEEGLLHRNSELPMPPVPLRVGVVTSLGSAAHADMLKVFTASGLAFEVTEVDTPVQGAEAPVAIAAAIATAASRADLVVLARGGGSTTDLSTFDHEIVARGITRCERPVLTGIGHETDRSAADEVAHTACSTPTAAAREVVSRIEDWLARLEDTAQAIEARSHRNLAAAAQNTEAAASSLSRLARASAGRADSDLTGAARRLTRAGQVAAEQAESSLSAATHRLARSSRGAIKLSGGRLAVRGRRLAQASRNADRRARSHLDQASARFALACRLDLRNAAGQLDGMEARIRSLDPASVLRRGWSLTRRSDGTLLRSVDDVEPDDLVTTHLADGKLTSSILSRQRDDADNEFDDESDNDADNEDEAR